MILRGLQSLACSLSFSFVLFLLYDMEEILSFDVFSIPDWKPSISSRSSTYMYRSLFGQIHFHTRLQYQVSSIRSSFGLMAAIILIQVRAQGIVATLLITIAETFQSTITQTATSTFAITRTTCPATLTNGNWSDRACSEIITDDSWQANRAETGRNCRRIRTLEKIAA